jgi:hypothetical protein
MARTVDEGLFPQPPNPTTRPNEIPTTLRIVQLPQWRTSNTVLHLRYRDRGLQVIARDGARGMAVMVSAEESAYLVSCCGLQP